MQGADPKGTPWGQSQSKLLTTSILLHDKFSKSSQPASEAAPVLSPSSVGWFRQRNFKDFKVPKGPVAPGVYPHMIN